MAEKTAAQEPTIPAPTPNPSPYPTPTPSPVPVPSSTEGGPPGSNPPATTTTTTTTVPGSSGETHQPMPKGDPNAPQHGDAYPPSQAPKTPGSSPAKTGPPITPAKKKK